jgi:hypothetical protein
VATPRELGKLAHLHGINAPTLDEALSQWINDNQGTPKAECMAGWWGGWYEGLDEKINRSSIQFIDRS